MPLQLLQIVANGQSVLLIPFAKQTWMYGDIGDQQEQLRGQTQYIPGRGRTIKVASIPRNRFWFA